MSGGSWDYIYRKFEDTASYLENTPEYKSCRAERIALGKVVKLVADAMHAIEWVDSLDYVAGDEREPIMKVISRSQALDAAAEILAKEIKNAQDTLARLTSP